MVGKQTGWKLGLPRFQIVSSQLVISHFLFFTLTRNLPNQKKSRPGWVLQKKKRVFKTPRRWDRGFEAVTFFWRQPSGSFPLCTSQNKSARRENNKKSKCAPGTHQQHMGTVSPFREKYRVVIHEETGMLDFWLISQLPAGLFSTAVESLWRLTVQFGSAQTSLDIDVDSKNTVKKWAKNGARLPGLVWPNRSPNIRFLGRW